MTFALSITDAQITAAVGAVLVGILPGTCEVIRGQVNRVPTPTLPDYVVMTPLRRTRLATNVDVMTVTRTGLQFVGSTAIRFIGTAPIRFYSETGVSTAGASTEVVIQLDVHGPAATDNSQLITTLWRDDYTCEAFAGQGLDIRPLYTTDPQQTAFINGENQYEDRWALELSLQATPTVSTPLQFADTLALGLIDVDAVYPPGAH